MHRFKNILCLVDADETSKQVLQHAEAVARTQQAKLTLVCVVENLPQKLELQDDFIAAEKILENALAQRRQYLKGLIESVKSTTVINYKVLTGTAFISIIQEVLRHQFDLLIKHADSGGLMQRLFGSLDMHLLRKCPVPVWLLKNAEPRVNKRILAAVDVENHYPQHELDTRYQLNRSTLETAGAVASIESAELYVVSVWEAIAEDFIHSGVAITDNDVNRYVDSVSQRYRTNLDALLSAWATDNPRLAQGLASPQSILLKGLPRKKIPEFAREIDADLVVMGTVARTGISGLIMGNTAESILNELNCSVLAIKPPGFVSPVKLDE